jgi:hypothetical protein
LSTRVPASSRESGYLSPNSDFHNSIVFSLVAAATAAFAVVRTPSISSTKKVKSASVHPHVVTRSFVGTPGSVTTGRMPAALYGLYAATTAATVAMKDSTYPPDRHHLT